jgi:catechol 2,3-dioxygenase-like lactoylglutathione lyase family enzyme
MWGERVAKLQGLGADTTACIWWLVGSQNLFQLEFFHHSDPPQRPLPSDWLPNSLGWVRWGIDVVDFDAVLEGLEHDNVTVSETIRLDGLRHASYRDPEFGVVVEVIEAATSATHENIGRKPKVVSVTLSVADLHAARDFYVGVLGFEEVGAYAYSLDRERTWGLPQAQLEGFVLGAGEVALEIVHYISPTGKTQGLDRRLSDQGIMNIAISYGERTSLEQVLARVAEAGCTISAPLRNHPVASTYLTDPLGNSVEMLCVAPGFEESYGYVARPSFPPPAVG